MCRRDFLSKVAGAGLLHRIPPVAASDFCVNCYSDLTISYISTILDEAICTHTISYQITSKSKVVIMIRVKISFYGDDVAVITAVILVLVIAVTP